MENAPPSTEYSRVEPVGQLDVGAVKTPPPSSPAVPPKVLQVLSEVMTIEAATTTLRSGQPGPEAQLMDPSYPTSVTEPSESNSINKQPEGSVEVTLGKGLGLPEKV